MSGPDKKRRALSLLSRTEDVFARIRATIDGYSYPLHPYEAEALQKRRTVDAVQHIRRRLGCDVRDAKDILDAHDTTKYSRPLESVDEAETLIEDILKILESVPIEKIEGIDLLLRGAIPVPGRD